MQDVRLVCVDVDGTISDRFLSPTVPGAAAALGLVRKRLALRLVTNATSRSHASLAELLQRQGLLEDSQELITPAIAARQVLSARGEDSGLLLVDEAASEDFRWFRSDPQGKSVLLGTEAHSMTIAELQPAFRMLLGGASLYTLQKNRYFRKGNELMTDLGPVAALLSYASNRGILNVGKPSRLLFETLAQDSGCALGEVAMVGDDAEFDASGSVAIGMKGLLVRTGKYRDGDEARFDPPPTATLDSVADLPRWLGLAG